MPSRLSIAGQRFGRLRVLESAGSANGVSRWLCRCDCGNEKVVLGKDMRSGNTSSCGCLSREVNGNRTHGRSQSKPYKVWKSMVKRCVNPKDPAYARYGGRGIVVCSRWRFGEGGLSGFECFISDMGERPEGLTVERVNNDGNYEPENCRWDTRRAQSRNKRDNGKVKFRGKIYSWAELGDISAASADAVRSRIMYRGWDVERAVSTPSQRKTPG